MPHPASSWDDLRRLPLTQWRPVEQVRHRVTSIARAAVPAIDVHNHLGRWLSDGEWMVPDVAELVGVMDEVGVETVVNLDGLWGDEVTANVERYDRAYPGRFLTFCHLDWSRLASPDGVQELCRSLDDSVRRGARGVKIWKTLGLGFRDADGSLISPDDQRVAAVLRHAGERGLPVLIHTADPMAFFEPLDERNERLDELLRERDWWFGDPSVHPTFDRLLDAHRALVQACPDVQFIGAHAGCAAEDLDRVERMLDACPNYTIDIGGRMAELGRQPRRFAELVGRHPDRVLFGTDIYPATTEQFRLHFRFLETDDEAFEYAPGHDIPPQGRWSIAALALDEPLLAGIYRDNARRVLGLG
ncbi:MAG: amidohydrolase family protein [Microbacterium sp.]|uniref:amidohydrolase family protein n=1 Tax=Microbacterium sp. TaxID=51671 RepID=UPI0039E39608